MLLFRTNKKFLLESLVDYINMNKYDLKWLLAVPYVHFLSGRVQPGKPIELTRQHDTQEWWGIEEFHYVVDKVKDDKKFDRKYVSPIPLN